MYTPTHQLVQQEEIGKETSSGVTNDSVKILKYYSDF